MHHFLSDFQKCLCSEIMTPAKPHIKLSLTVYLDNKQAHKNSQLQKTKCPENGENQKKMKFHANINK